MCIIVAKPAGISLPAMKTLENCWDENPHGAGFMYAHRGMVHIRKGLMEYADFDKAIRDLGKRHNITNLPLVLHFRISTQAGVNAANTHPFPITRENAVLGATQSSSNIGAVAHNGIISCCTSANSKTPYSDTYLFVRDYVARLVKKPSSIKQEWIQTLIEETAQSKLAFLLPTGEIIALGRFIKEDGVLYSNDTFRENRYPLWAATSLQGCGDDFDPDDLFPCEEGMCYFDEDALDFVECDPDIHCYDQYGELWYHDPFEEFSYPLCVRVHNDDFTPITMRLSSGKKRDSLAV